MPDEILFIDDEEFFAQRYIERLKEQDFAVHYCADADDARMLLESRPSINAIILDIMMPTPRGVPGTLTEEGLSTGLWLLDQVKDYVYHKRPLLVLTNRNPHVVEERLASLEFPEWLFEVRRKVETPAFFLPGHLANFLAEARKKLAH
jgi:CheY-like chemotaxis protein